MLLVQRAQYRLSTLHTSHSQCEVLLGRRGEVCAREQHKPQRYSDQRNSDSSSRMLRAHCIDDRIGDVTGDAMGGAAGPTSTCRSRCIPLWEGRHHGGFVGARGAPGLGLGLGLGLG